MSQFTHEIRDGVAVVTFDSGGMNTLSQQAVADLRAKTEELGKIHRETPLEGVILTGNRYGLGAGANIGELMNASKEELGKFIDVGHETLYAIEDGPIPWVALIDGFALGGIYEMALACHGIVATAKSTFGFPEIKLNIFPGLGGTQRMPRRSGVLREDGDGGFPAILQGKNYKAARAAEINMIDAVVPDGEDPVAFAISFLKDTLPTVDRTPHASLAQAEELKGLVLPAVQKATQGRENPRAPYVAMDVIIAGSKVSLKEGNKIERDAFLDVASSAEGKAGMRFFFTQQRVQKLPKGFPAKPRKLEKIGIDGADGFMGNAIAWLCLEAGYDVVGHAPLEKFMGNIEPKLLQKYGRAVKSGKMSEDDAKAKVAKVKITADINELADCDLVIEARMENEEIKASFYRELGKILKKDALVASNSSSMGPGLLGGYFAEGGGDPSRFVNLHFFSPAEHPMMQLVEVVRGEKTTDDAVATAHAFTISIKKTPVLLGDGSAGFLVNAGLAAYWAEAEAIYMEGTPIEKIDKALRSKIFPMGPFELGDAAGLDIAAGLFDTIAKDKPPVVEPLIWKIRETGRFGQKTQAGYYNWENGKKTGPWEGLSALAGERGTSEAGEDEIVERCMKALYAKAKELLDRGIVGSAEECDLSFVFGIGFAMYLGGPIFYAEQQGWA